MVYLVILLLLSCAINTHDFFKTFSHHTRLKSLYLKENTSHIIEIFRVGKLVENSMILESFLTLYNGTSTTILNDSTITCVQQKQKQKQKINKSYDELDHKTQLDFINNALQKTNIFEALKVILDRFKDQYLIKSSEQQKENSDAKISAKGKFFDYEEYGVDDFPETNDQMFYINGEIIELNYADGVSEAIVFDGFNFIKEDLATNLKRLKQIFGNICLNHDVLSGFKVCPFRKVIKGNTLYNYVDQKESLKDFLINAENRLSFSMNFEIFFGMSQSPKKEIISVYFICSPTMYFPNPLDHRVITSKGVYLILTNLVCVNATSHATLINLFVFDPKAASLVVQASSLSNPCDSIKVGNSTYRYCFGEKFEMTSTDNISIAIGAGNNESSWKLTRISGDNESSFLSVLLNTSHYCDNEEQKRFSAKIVFICYDGMIFLRKFKLLSVETLDNCDYLITIGSPYLCQHPFFSHNEEIKTTTCFYKKDQNDWDMSREPIY